MRSSTGSALDDIDIDGTDRNSISLSVLNNKDDANTNQIKSKLTEYLLPNNSTSKYITMEQGVTEVSKEMWKKHLIGLYSQYVILLHHHYHHYHYH